MRRYEAMPNTRAQLINGTVHVRGFTRYNTYGGPVAKLVGWLGMYLSKHPSLIGGTQSTTFLSDLDVVEPAAFLTRAAALGSRACIGDDDYIHGAPDLVCEVAASTVSVDAHAKSDMYAAAGVREYILWRTAERPEPTIDWFRLTDDGLYRPIEPDADGIIESTIFPGLKLHRPALLRGDLAAVLAVLSGNK